MARNNRFETAVSYGSTCLGHCRAKSERVGCKLDMMAAWTGLRVDPSLSWHRINLRGWAAGGSTFNLTAQRSWLCKLWLESWTLIVIPIHDWFTPRRTHLHFRLQPLSTTIYILDWYTILIQGFEAISHRSSPPLPTHLTRRQKDFYTNVHTSTYDTKPRDTKTWTNIVHK